MFFSQWLYSVDDETAFPLQDSQGQCECLYVNSEHVQVETSLRSHTMQLPLELLARFCDNLDSLSWSLFDLWLFSSILLLKTVVVREVWQFRVMLYETYQKRRM